MNEYDTNQQSEGECNDCRSYEKEIKRLREQLKNAVEMNNMLISEIKDKNDRLEIARQVYLNQSHY